MLYRALSLSLLFSFYSHTADPSTPTASSGYGKKNNDQLISEANGNWTGKPVVTGTTNMPPTPQMPKGPEINPQFPYTNQPQPSSTVGSTAGGSVINLMSDLLRNDQPDIDALRREKQIADFQASLQKYGEHTTAQFFPALYEKYMQAKNPTPMGFAPDIVSHTPAPVVMTPTPTPTVSAPIAQAPVMPKFVATKSLNFTNGTIKNTDFLDLDNSQKMAKTAENFATSMAAPSPLQSSSESNSGNGVAGLVGGGALLAQVATAPAAPAATAGGGTVATTS
jgi:hypothetical protein